jgi:hypothetical protein
MEYPKYFKYFCILALSTGLIYLILSKNHTHSLPSLNIPFILSYVPVDLYFVNTSISNQTNDSIVVDLSLSTKQFEARVSDYYPRLPIHIFTQNLSLIGNTSKLILLGNGFFGDRSWEGMISAGKSSTPISNNY